MVRSCRIDDGSLAGAADRTADRLPPIDPAIAGAEIAIFQMLARQTGAFAQLARVQQAKVGRFGNAMLPRVCRGGDIGRHGGVSSVPENEQLESARLIRIMDAAMICELMRIKARGPQRPAAAGVFAEPNADQPHFLREDAAT